MKNLRRYNDFITESTTYRGKISIEDYIDAVNNDGLLTPHRENIIKWWNENRENIDIHYFPFSKLKAYGAVLSENAVAVNSDMRIPSEFLLFLILHESRHLDQMPDNEFEDGYYINVVNNDLENFSKSYKLLERDANQYANNTLEEMGIMGVMSKYSLDRNESMGIQVFSMMRRDIEKYKSTSFLDLIRKQIL